MLCKTTYAQILCAPCSHVFLHGRVLRHVQTAFTCTHAALTAVKIFLQKLAQLFAGHCKEFLQFDKEKVFQKPLDGVLNYLGTNTCKDEDCLVHDCGGFDNCCPGEITASIIHLHQNVPVISLFL